MCVLTAFLHSSHLLCSRLLSAYWLHIHRHSLQTEPTGYKLLLKSTCPAQHITRVNKRELCCIQGSLCSVKNFSILFFWKCRNTTLKILPISKGKRVSTLVLYCKNYKLHIITTTEELFLHHSKTVVKWAKARYQLNLHLSSCTNIETTPFLISQF